MLYTGKGDNGTTKLFGAQERIPKSSLILEALGTVDELNAWTGLCRARAAEDREHDVRDMLLNVQQDLFIIQAQCAGAPKTLEEKHLRALESAIARVETEIPPITSFTVPGETALSGSLDVARTVARRTERALVALQDERFRAHVIPYVNRLSSLLFAFARLTAYRAGKTERAPHY